MNYEETLSYLFDQLPMFQRVGAAAYRKNLGNTLTLARMTEHPEDGFKSIHIAGTNGKGSTAHGLASVFQSCGYKTGLMTSPHYKDFRERIRVNGEMISEDYIVDWVERYRKRFEAVEPSFFELTVLMGFSYFREQKVDIAIIETGMGGRLDSTNIVTPELSIITPIGFDHTTFLGDTLEKIAMEKAGIIKQNVPSLIAQGNEEVMEVFRSVSESRSSPMTEVHQREDPISTDMRGDYQQSNMATVLGAVSILREGGWKLPEEQVTEGLKNVIASTGFMGRWQQISTAPRIIVDSAHNLAGIQTLLKNLAQERYKKLHIVIGMVDDKDVETVLSELPIGAIYYFCQAKVIRAMSCSLLAQRAIQMSLLGECYGSVESALTAAMDTAKKDDLILVTGSVFTVAEVM